jgi:hypothetical protein
MNREPVPQPMLTHLLAEAIHEENVAAGRRPKAFDTMFRHSDSGDCIRKMALDYLDYPETDPPDLADEEVMWLGTTVHEFFGDALVRKMPGAEVEVKVRHGDLTSGHLDALITTPEGVRICFELKTKGSFRFDKAVGLMRKSWARKEPEGPPLGDVLQGSLNALAAGADLLIIGILGLEAMSKGYAEKVGASELDRIMAEWHYSRAEFEPLALAELERLAEGRAWIEAGQIPPRWGLNDLGYSVTLDPAYGKYPCSYCRFRSLCAFIGAEPTPHPVPGWREWMKGDLAGLLEVSRAVQ